MSEILGTLFKYLLALLAITAVVGILYQALGSNKISTAASQLTTLQANINQLYAGTTSGPSGLSNTTLISAAVVPPGMQTNATAGTITNSWGGTVAVQPDGTLTNDVDISFAGVPQQACVKLATALLPSMAQITIGSTVVTAADTKTAPTTEIATACAAGASSNTLIFTFPVS